MIVNVTSAGSAGAHPSVHLYSYVQIPQPATSMPLTQSGPLKKLIIFIAAEFDVTMSAELVGQNCKSLEMQLMLCSLP